MVLTAGIGILDGSDVGGIDADGGRQVLPFGVGFVDECLFPGPVPLFQLFFSVDALVQPIVHFIVNELFGVVLGRKAIVYVQLVFCNPTTEVSGDTRVERGIILVGEYVYYALEFHVFSWCGSRGKPAMRGSDEGRSGPR